MSSEYQGNKAKAMMNEINCVVTGVSGKNEKQGKEQRGHSKCEK